MLRRIFLCIASVVAAGVASAAVIVVDPPDRAGKGVSPSVNRNLKGDLLPMRIAKRGGGLAADSAGRNAPVPKPATPMETPVGCDPAFSPVASPALANVFGRCMT